MFVTFSTRSVSLTFIEEAFRRLAFLSALLCLSACTGLPQPADDIIAPGRDALRGFTLDGRFSLRHEDKSYSGRLSWRHAEKGDERDAGSASDELLLASPLGQGMAEIFSNASGARLTTGDGRTYAAKDAETLTQQVLGYPLPLGKLAGWVRGHRGAPGKFIASLETDASGRPLRLREDGWRIDYEYDSDDPQALPGRLFVERAGEGGFDLRLRIDEWTQLRTPLKTQLDSELKDGLNGSPVRREGKTRP